MDELLFAQKFPFSKKAREIIKNSGLDLSSIPKKAIIKAIELIRKADFNETFFSEINNPYEEDIKLDIVSYPVAKLLLSSMKKPNVIEKFSEMVAKTTFSNLTDLKIDSNEIKKLCFELADDLKINYSLNENNLIVINLLDYLKIYFIFDEMKLVNKQVSGGKIILNDNNDFARYISEKVYFNVFNSLPISKESIPKELIEQSKQIDKSVAISQQKKFDTRVSGKMDPLLFPPSMQNLYTKQLAGEKLTYYERLSIGGFLQQVGMAKEEMLTFFSKSPDFKLNIAKYHVDRIYVKELSAPSYKKMDEYGIIISKDEKKFKHPFSFYLFGLRMKNKQKNKIKSDENVL